MSDCWHSHTDWNGINRKYYSGSYKAGDEDSSDDTRFGYTKENCWEAIRAALLFVENVERVPDMEDAEKKRLAAEAKVIVASRYFDLFRHFGGLPLIKETYDVQPSYELPRATVEETVNYMINLLGEAAAEAAAALEPGHVLVLENVRFDKREKKNDPEIAKKLADLADIFVLDAFGTAHRAQGSVVGPAQYLPAVAGFLLEKEVSTLSGLFSEPKRPFVAILGGSKVSDKIGVIDRLLDSADTVIVGGGMAYTFAKAQGGKIGNSLCEDDWCDRALEMLDKAKKNGVNFLLPVDNVVADDFANDANTKIAKTGEIEDGWQGLDIGPETEQLFADAIAGAKTVFWNGPCGVFEMDTFAHGTKAIAEAIAANQDCDSVIGGGDSVAAVNKFGLADKMTFISTGGGASMQLVEGKPLPGVEALNDAE
nr:phosphoglycerate kinase [uncultured Enorma sp.]